MVAYSMLTAKAVVLTSLLGAAVAHPGEHLDAAKRKRDLDLNDVAVKLAERQSSICAQTEMGKALAFRGAQRRALKAIELRKKRGLEYSGMKARRDQESLDKYMAECHDVSLDTGYTLETPTSTIFGGNATTGLAPETIIGPYWVSGEAIRQDITEGEAGVPVHADFQFIDIATCQPVSNTLIDLWHANALGSYSGVTAGAGLDTTFLRGVQITDAEGVAQFDTIFPGHYTGRVNHIHISSNVGATRHPNNTYSGGTVNHIGQIYFDQDLLNAIEKTEPYPQNTMAPMTNSADMLAAQQASANYDPFMDYVYLGDDPADGLLMWLTIGIDTKANYNSQATAGAHYYEGGGVEAAPGGGFPSFPPGGDFPGQPGQPSDPPANGACLTKRMREE